MTNGSYRARAQQPTITHTNALVKVSLTGCVNPDDNMPETAIPPDPAAARNTTYTYALAAEDLTLTTAKGTSVHWARQ
ncbi:MAG: hypothetical protein EXR72_09460 [Myxococcales bacterium]|nr:hypothetical protein [Myxococcales bacterium]